MRRRSILQTLPFLLLLGCGTPKVLKYKHNHIRHKRKKMAGFTIQGSKIFDPSGKEFIIKGANLLGLIYDKAKVYSASEVDTIKNAWKFNLVRMPFRANKQGTAYNGYTEFDANVKAFTNAGIVVMFDGHDTVGGGADIAYYTNSSNPSLSKLNSMYKELASRYKNNPYVWFDLVNEPDWGKSDKTNWLNMHQTLIKTIRDDVGAENIIVCEGWWYGQDSGAYGSSSMVSESQSAILSFGNQLKNFNNKAYKNIGFSFHIYDQWVNNSEAKIGDYVDKAIAKGHLLLVGEYGMNNAGKSTMTASKGMFAALPKRKVGRIVWSYDASARNICTDGSGNSINKKDGTKPSNLTELGSLIWDDNRRTESLASINIPNPIPVPTPTPSTPTPKPVPTGTINLVVQSVKVKPDVWRKGSTVTFEVVVKNSGTAPMAKAWVGVLFYVDGTYINWAGLDTEIQAGQTVTLESSPWVATSSTFDLKALVDDHDVIKESNEDDNTITVKLD